MRVVVAASVLCALASTAQADSSGREAAVAQSDGDAPAPAADKPREAIEISAQAGVGAGVVGVEPVSAIDARGDLTWDGGAVGLGARLRVIGDALVTEDWDEVADWFGLVRYLVVRNRADREAARLPDDAALAVDDRWRLALVAGTLGAVRVGTSTLVDGLSASALADRRATGAHVRAGRGAMTAEVVATDVARAGVAAIAAEAPAGPIAVIGAVAIDPRAPVGGADEMITTAPLTALSAAAAIDAAGAAWRARAALDLAWEPGLGAGVALVGSGERRLGERLVVRGRAELGAGTGGFVAAPFGPLYLRLRDVTEDGTLLDAARAGGLGGLGGALAGTIAVDELGAASASLRHRPGLGDELAARISAPASRWVQAAAEVAWMPSQDALLAGAEARVELGHRMWSALELARQYRAGDTMGLVAERPVSLATAWFGVAY